MTGQVLGRFAREARDIVTGRLCVIKGPFSPSPEEGRFHHEAHVLSNLSINGVVGLRQCLRTSKRCWLVLDRLPGNSLGRTSIQGDRAGWLVARLARILNQCHQQGWVHGDICPSNIQYGNNQMWLLDFGASLAIGQHYPMRRQVRPCWSSPALLTGKGRVSEADDVYSLLLLSCSLLTSQSPVEAIARKCSARLLQRPGRINRRQWRFLRRGLEKPEAVSMQDITIQALGW